MPIIFCLLPSSSRVILVFYLFSTGIMNNMCENCECKTVNTVHWFDASCSVIPVNNSITLIPPVQAGLHFTYSTSWAIFFAADSICVALKISEQFSPKARTPTHWMPSSDEILKQNVHSRSFKVIRFGVNEEPLRGYIVQYNNLKVRKI